jgi:sarcosine oxidase gamma subunit
MLVLGIIAAADVAARAAKAKVHPSITHDEAFLAAIALWRVGPDEFAVIAYRSHVNPLRVDAAALFEHTSDRVQAATLR